MREGGGVAIRSSLSVRGREGVWPPDQVCQYEKGRGCGHQIKSVSMREEGGVATRSSMSV